MNLNSSKSRAHVILAVFLSIGVNRVDATCPGCTQFGTGTSWGTTTATSLNEASGLAMSTRNPGVIYTHNDDGDDGRVFAFHTNGMLLARYNMNTSLIDVEDMAVGPGPVPDTTYIYVGDIGGGNSVRSAVKIIRKPEAIIPLTWTNNPATPIFVGMEAFTLLYPDGSYDAETLMLDPVSGDVLLGTKGNDTRIYVVNLNSATNEQVLMMQYVTTVPFSSASGGAISANGGRIVLRRANHAEMWTRCAGETVGDALARAGQSIPVIGPPSEPNGEAIAFVPDGTGYITISDSMTQPPIYFFPASCSLYAPGTEIVQQPHSSQVNAGTDVVLSVVATGQDLTYQWRLNNADIPGATSSNLLLQAVQPGNVGTYTVSVSGAGGSVVSSPAVITVRILPPVILTQPQNTLAATGSIAHLSVIVQGTAPLTFLWSRNGRSVPGSTSTLSLTNVQRADAGKYGVTISNSVGRVTSTLAQLKVLNPPVILIHPQPKTVATGGKAAFRARATGSGPLRYQWLFNGASILNATKPQLALKAVQPSQSGNYSVTVSNAVGGATSSGAELLIQ